MPRLIRLCAVILSALLGLIAVLPADSQERQAVGVGRLFSNDFPGDGKDRWHATSYVVSALSEPIISQTSPATSGHIIEHRLSGKVVAPANLHAVAADDRPYSGVLSYSHHRYLRNGDALNRIGIDVVVGPQAGVGQLQGWVHDGLTAPRPELEAQLPNAIYPTLSGEVAKSFHLSRVELRPFAEVQLGVETFARLGADVFADAFFGQRDAEQMRLRDVTTGQLYNSASALSGPDIEFMPGADMARVWSSKYLPVSDGYMVEPARFRGRAGVQVSVPQADMFYGVTWLGPQFENQPSDQVVGSLNVSLRF